MPCYRDGGCGPYENRSCTECPASKASYLKRSNPHLTMHEAAQRLINNCEINAAKNECRCSTMNGIGNLSRSDLDTLVFYAETLQRDGNTFSLMELHGDVAKVWAAYGLPSTKKLY